MLWHVLVRKLKWQHQTADVYGERQFFLSKEGGKCDEFESKVQIKLPFKWKLQTTQFASLIFFFFLIND